MTTAPEDGLPEGVPDLTELPAGALYTARLPMALAYAAVQHSTQRRKHDLGLPYITHPMAVATNVWRYGLPHEVYGDEMEDLVIAGLLHDVVEDSGGADRLDEIHAMFGPRVAQIVEAASDSTVADRSAKREWHPRKTDHMARIRLLARPQTGEPDRGACLVIACDKMHNLTETAADYRAEGEQTLERFNGKVDGTRWYFRSMFEALRPALPPELIRDAEADLAAIGA